MATSDAPITIDSVTLTVRDLAKVAAFYEDVIGLARLSDDGHAARLGVDGRTLVVLEADPSAPSASQRAAGLFHTAFLLPSREALGGWLSDATARGVALDGASDHIVSEAIYLDDPEGNGIEVYADRPRADWQHEGGSVVMRSDPLDLHGLAAAGTPWRSAPTGTVIGHVHLKAGQLASAEAFWTETVGLDISCRYPGATFFSSGGYHHHIATNVWRNAGAGPIGPGTGLRRVTLRADADHAAAIATRTGEDAAIRLADPWGVAIEVVGG